MLRIFCIEWAYDDRLSAGQRLYLGSYWLSPSYATMAEAKQGVIYHADGRELERCVYLGNRRTYYEAKPLKVEHRTGYTFIIV